MRERQRLASVAVVVIGALWGLYWWPVRALEGTVLEGAWGTLLIVLMSALVLSPVALTRWRELRDSQLSTLLVIALGGAGFALYSIGLSYGRVAIIILMFYLTPVWSTLIGRLLGWPTPWLRYAVIALGMAGLLLVLSGGESLPLPRSLGDWFGLASGFMWAVCSIGMQLRRVPSAMTSTFVFSLGAVAMSLVLALTMGAPVSALGAVDWGGSWYWVALLGVVWWAVMLSVLLWANTHLEPARLAILLMSEVIVGVFSAALWAGEPLGAVEMIGGALVVGAALLEVMPVRRGAARPRTRH
ncbi:DMT family transporter [Larsenimonas suaedae]|uniref:DMT family transporter n=1 Tax=Larsenimonas suaedae TaxID=1851019 RepID=A0ABU1GW52_9GAMM|nr:DMT family transporter [Larsenimonas suaedae]MCM2973388.1 DMT family transporter [Larsenimonas suaedae]MDR5896281.1 DMT family transporter [Larsenimonas suaedae]